jgi:hypothetical protein
MDIASRWIRWHVNNGLELTTMMLDTWDINRDRDFAVKTMLPLASEITMYFDQHWPRVAGKLHFDPSAALETRQSAVNPAPDLAGLMDVLPRLLALPDTLTTPVQRAMWKQMLADLPPLPIGRADDKGRARKLRTRHRLRVRKSCGRLRNSPNSKTARTPNCIPSFRFGFSASAFRNLIWLAPLMTRAHTKAASAGGRTGSTQPALAGRPKPAMK